MRWVAHPSIVIAMIALIALITLGGCKMEGVYFIPGTGTLPDCDEAPVANLNGTGWFDNGTVTIQTAGCQEAIPGDVFPACALDWVFTRDDENLNDVTIIVDNEYRIDGRLCGDQLHLRGGWWLPVEDEDVNYCTYEDDSAEEVGIMAAGNVLTYAATRLTSSVPTSPETSAANPRSSRCQAGRRCRGRPREWPRPDAGAATRSPLGWGSRGRP